MNRKLSLGIDTSNYKTSVAVVDADGNILFNHQQLLKVKEGERGLRQSEALFQHVQNLPPVLEAALSQDSIRENIGIVSVSTRPRPVEGSYMPVFTAGQGYARSIAAALDVPLHLVSHQEGHIQAIRFYSELKVANPLICFHFSGGTTEAVLVNGKNMEIVGGSKDLAYGQVLDRIGVALGMAFPAGAQMDEIAMNAPKRKKKQPAIFTRIKVNDGYVNLSGLETQGQRLLLDNPKELLISDLFDTMSRSVCEMTMQLSEKYEIDNFIYAGGVSCSQTMRRYLAEHLDKRLHIAFGRSELSSDNAVGAALLGGEILWH